MDILTDSPWYEYHSKSLSLSTEFGWGTTAGVYNLFPSLFLCARPASLPPTHQLEISSHSADTMQRKGAKSQREFNDGTDSDLFPWSSSTCAFLVAITSSALVAALRLLADMLFCTSVVFLSPCGETPLDPCWSREEDDRPCIQMSHDEQGISQFRGK